MCVFEYVLFIFCTPDMMQPNAFVRASILLIYSLCVVLCDFLLFFEFYGCCCSCCLVVVVCCVRMCVCVCVCVYVFCSFLWTTSMVQPNAFARASI